MTMSSKGNFLAIDLFQKEFLCNYFSLIPLKIASTFSLKSSFQSIHLPPTPVPTMTDSRGV